VPLPPLIDLAGRFWDSFRPDPVPIDGRRRRSAGRSRSSARVSTLDQHHGSQVRWFRRAARRANSGSSAWIDRRALPRQAAA